MKDTLALADLKALVASNRNTIYVEHNDGSYWEATRVEIRNDRVFIAEYDINQHGKAAN